MSKEKQPRRGYSGVAGTVVLSVGLGLAFFLVVLAVLLGLGKASSSLCLMLGVVLVGGVVLYGVHPRKTKPVESTGPTAQPAPQQAPLPSVEEILGQVGSATSPLVIMDLEDLPTWEGRLEPSLGAEDIGDPQLRSSVEQSRDMSLVGPDAQVAADRYNIPGLHLYDVPAHRIDPYLERFTILQGDRPLAAELVVEPRRASHVERAERAALLQGQVFTVRTQRAFALPVEEEVHPITGRSILENGERRLDYLEIPVHAEGSPSVSSSRVVGEVTSRSGVLVLAGAEALSGWVEPVSSTDNYEVRVEGSGAPDAAARYDGTLVTSEVAVWRDLTAPDADRLATALANWWAHLSGSLNVSSGPVTFLSDVSLRTHQLGSVTLTSAAGPLLLVAVPAGVPLRVLCGFDDRGWVSSYRLVAGA